jgi:phosphoribosylformimino-5-aminoimidazole carboxamide ribonucleotide (ProFAR) isomerase
MAELLTDDIIYEAIEADGIMREPDATWLVEKYTNEKKGIEIWFKGGVIEH